MIKNYIKYFLKNLGYELRRFEKKNSYHEELFEKYREFTMIPKQVFVLNLELCDYYKHIEGDYVECGVWRGGMSAAISEIVENKHLHLFDSFEGLPEAKEIDGKEALKWQADKDSPGYYDNCSAEESFAKSAMANAGNANYTLYKGWFDKTMASYPKNSISILRLDSDWYDSIKVCLENLFQYVKPGGIIILDDYYAWDGCAKAVHDYLSSTKSPSRIHEWKGIVPYIIKKNG